MYSNLKKDKEHLKGKTNLTRLTGTVFIVQ